MYYGSGRSSSAYSEGRTYNSYGKGLSYNYSSDLSLSSLSSRNPSIQRVINSEYGRPDRSLSPSRDYSSGSRVTAFRPLSSGLSGDTSPTVRRRDTSLSSTDRSSPASFLNDDLGYSAKSRNYYDFPSTSSGMFSYSSTIKKPKRTDYTDYFRPILSSRPVLKSGYVPRSRAERDSDVSTPIIRERKLIKFREMSDEVLEKIRRKISWDLPEEISSPLIDEMRQKLADSEDKSASQQTGSRRGSKDTVAYTPGTSPISGSPRPSISRRASGDQSMDKSIRPPMRKNSRTNSLITSTIECIQDAFGSEDMLYHSKAPIPPPRKKSLRSSHRHRKSSKSSVDILLSEEKTQNYSKIAEDIRRSREIAECIKRLADESAKENRHSSEPDETEVAANNESGNLEESEKCVPDRSRRRRRRTSIPEHEATEDKPPDSGRRRRSRLSNESISPLANSKSPSNEKFVDEAPRPTSRMHRKSVKYKSDRLSHKRSSKNADLSTDSAIPSQKVSSTADSKDSKSVPTSKSESNMKSDLKTSGIVSSKSFSNQVVSNESKIKLEKDKREKLSDETLVKSQISETSPKFKSMKDKENRIENKADKNDVIKTEGPDAAKKVLTQEKKIPAVKSISVDKTLKTERNELDSKNTVGKTSKTDNKLAGVNSVSSTTLKADTKVIETKLDKKIESEPKKLTLSDSSNSKIAKIEAKMSEGKLSNEKADTDTNLLTQESETQYLKKSEDCKKLLPNGSSSKISNMDVTEIKGINKFTKAEQKNTSLQDSSNNKVSKMESKGIDIKTSLDKKINKIEEKTNLKYPFSDSLQTEPSKTKSEMSQKSEKSLNKILDVKVSSSDKITKPETKVENLEDLNKRSPKVDCKKSDEKQIVESAKVNDLKNVNSKESLTTDNSSKLTVLKPISEPDVGSKLKPLVPCIKEAEEIVIVCKLPKKNDLARKKSIPNEQNVVVSIKGTALKTIDVAESNDDLPKNNVTKVNSIIPASQSRDSNLKSCDKLKSAESRDSEVPDVNVTHTIVLKPKPLNKSKDADISNNFKMERGGTHLKPIPDVIKSTVNCASKTNGEVSDVVKSTLPNTDNQIKSKKVVLPDIKDISTNRGDKKTVNDKSSEKLSPTSETVSKEKVKPELKQLNNEVSLTAPKDSGISKDLLNIKKSAVLDSSKEVSTNTNLSNMKSSSATLSEVKDVINAKSNIKPDLIQMTAKPTDNREHKDLSVGIKDALPDKQATEEKKIFKIQNDISVPLKTDTEVKTSIKPKKYEINDTNSVPKSSKEKPSHLDSCEKGIQKTEQKKTDDKSKSVAFNKTHSSILKQSEVKDTTIIKTKSESDKPSVEVKSVIDKATKSETLNAVKSEVKQKEDSSHATKDAINKEKMISQKNEDKNLIPEVTKDIKKEAENLKTGKNITFLDNNVQKTKRPIPAYKKSMTAPNVNAPLEEMDSSKFKTLPVTNAQKGKNLDTSSMSDVSTTLKGTKISAQNDAGNTAIKCETETAGNLKSPIDSTNSQRKSSSPDKKASSNAVQLPKIKLSEIKGSEELEISKQVKATVSNSSTGSEIPTSDKKACTETVIENKSSDLSKSEDKTLKNETKLQSEVKTKDESKISKTVNLSHSSENKESNILPNKKEIAGNSMPKINSATSLEKDKQNSSLEVLKLPALHDTRKDTINLSQQDTISPLQTQSENLVTPLITRVGSVMRKDKSPTPKPADEKCEKNIKKEESKVIDESKFSKSTSKENTSLAKLPNSDSKTDKETDNLGIDIKTKSKEAPELQKQTEVTKESEPPKPCKVKGPKLPPVPPQYKRYGLFIRPKEIPKTILESSSSEESDTESESETETETESTSEEETKTPVIKQTSRLTNGKYPPERSEKSRSHSETSNASVNSNSTTYSTIPSSWDDDYGSPRRTEKSLKFRKYAIEDFVFLKLLGKGSFGKVLLAELKDTEMYFAIKCLKKDVVLEDDDVESTMIERRVLALGTQHPYMCKLYCTFQTKSYLYFVMEYLNGGDLMFHIQESGRFEEMRAMFYGAEIVSALKFLHKRGIVYRDIKLDNVMLDRQGHVRLVDFGMCQCRIYKEDCMPSNFCGTPTYIAPEIVMGQKYNQSVDWWSFGVLLYEMLIGRSPFQGTDEDELFWSICNEEPHYPRFLSKEATHILGLLLVKTPSKRLGMSSCPAGEIKDHAFFSSINWDKIENKQMSPIFRPSVSGPCDTSNFDSSFTADTATLSPIDSDVLKSMDQEQFTGFSYTNPHLTG